jgi:hypothetical protein
MAQRTSHLLVGALGEEAQKKRKRDEVQVQVEHWPVEHCCSQLWLYYVAVSAPNQPQPPQAPCSWPGLLELQLDSVQAGLVSHVLPTLAAASLLARLVPWAACPDSWPRGLQCASVTGEQQTAMEQLAADLRCLAACPVPCQALHLVGVHWQAAQLTSAVAMLAPSLTHLSLYFYNLVPQHLEALCMALPKLRSLSLADVDHLFLSPPSVSKLHSLHPSLCQLLLSGPASAEWVEQLLTACDAAAAAARPQGTLTVQLPHLHERKLAVAQQLWAQLAARVATPASRVVVTDHHGRDLLAV